MIIALPDRVPQIAAGAWIAPTATVVGDVVVEAGASIWYGVVLRGDRERIVIGADSNVQDNTVCHADPGSPVVIGRGVTIGHGAIVHGATVGDGALVGMGSTLLNGAVVGEQALVAAHALVTEGTVVPARTLAAGAPAKPRRELTADEAGRLGVSAQTYATLRELHRDATGGADRRGGIPD